MKIIAYANQPIVKHGCNFYTSHKNFIDFICYWASKTEGFSLIVPLKNIDASKTSDSSAYTRLSIDPQKIIAASSYKSHVGAILASITNQYIVLKEVKKTIRDPNSPELILVLPGPSMILSLLSFQLPRNLKVIVFVRGNSLKTITYMYEGNILKPLAIGLSTFFKKCLNKIQKKGAITFVFGSELYSNYSKYGATYNISPLIENDSIYKGRQSLAINTNKPTKILFVGRLSNEKGILELIDASKILIHRGVQFKLNIAGHGPLEKALTQRLLIEELNHTITFIGRLSPGEEVRIHIDSADLLIVPSKTEGIPRVIAESLSRGVPVLSTNVGGIKDAFGEAIDYLDGNSPKQIADGIQSLISNPKQLELKSKLRIKTATSCTFEANMKKIEAVITEKYKLAN